MLCGERFSSSPWPSRALLLHFLVAFKSVAARPPDPTSTSGPREGRSKESAASIKTAPAGRLPSAANGHSCFCSRLCSMGGAGGATRKSARRVAKSQVPVCPAQGPACPRAPSRPCRLHGFQRRSACEVGSTADVPARTRVLVLPTLQAPHPARPDSLVHNGSYRLSPRLGRKDVCQAPGRANRDGPSRAGGRGVWKVKKTVAEPSDSLFKSAPSAPRAAASALSRCSSSCSSCCTRRG